MWPDRPDCLPVGTTIETTRTDENSCTETRVFDEIGEAGLFAVGCQELITYWKADQTTWSRHITLSVISAHDRHV